MIKLFEQFNNEQEIHEICKKYNIENYTINTDGSIDVDGDVNISVSGLTEIPLKFNNVYGDFNYHNNNLTNLLGSPNYVNGTFACHKNNITSLMGGPVIIGTYFFCINNPISIIDSSIEVKKDIYIDDTDFDDKIKSLSQEKLKILFEHGVDYNIFRKDGSISDYRLERMFKDFEV